MENVPQKETTLYRGESFFSSFSQSLSQQRNSPFMEPEGSFCIHKNPPLVPNLSHMNPTHTLRTYFVEDSF